MLHVLRRQRIEIYRNRVRHVAYTVMRPTTRAKLLNVCATQLHSVYVRCTL